MSFSTDSQVLFDGRPQSDVQRIRNQSLPDRHFKNVGEGFEEGAEIIQIEVVPRVQPQVQAARHLPGSDVGGRQLGNASFRKSVGVGAGVKLHPIGAQGMGSFDFFRVWIHYSVFGKLV